MKQTLISKSSSPIVVDIDVSLELGFLYCSLGKCGKEIRITLMSYNHPAYRLTLFLGLQEAIKSRYGKDLFSRYCVSCKKIIQGRWKR